MCIIIDITMPMATISTARVSGAKTPDTAGLAHTTADCPYRRMADHRPERKIPKPFAGASFVHNSPYLAVVLAIETCTTHVLR